MFPQIALAIGVLTSSWGWGFADFVDSLGGLSHRVSLEVSSRGQGSQIQDQAAQGVVGGVVWCL